MSASAQWCQDACLECGNVVDAQTMYCSTACEATACPPDEDLDSLSYSSWHRVELWAQNVHPAPRAPTIYTSPSKRILTPQHPTACITSDSPLSSRPHPSPPRPARTSPTATESLVASSAGPTSPVSLGSFVRSWAPRPHLPRLTTAHFTVFAKPQPPPSDETTSDGDVSPVWWLSPEPDSPRVRRPAAARGRKCPAFCFVFTSAACVLFVFTNAPKRPHDDHTFSLYMDSRIALSPTAHSTASPTLTAGSCTAPHYTLDASRMSASMMHSVGEVDSVGEHSDVDNPTPLRDGQLRAGSVRLGRASPLWAAPDTSRDAKSTSAHRNHDTTTSHSPNCQLRLENAGCSALAHKSQYNWIRCLDG
ncbi:hypothetical protein C8R44DRAFT_977725 [Mycena epipterygia]|nr:hypothetical protein C8R44DRAFT_977725 [Mycena epipterygia]